MKIKVNRDMTGAMIEIGGREIAVISQILGTSNDEFDKLLDFLEQHKISDNYARLEHVLSTDICTYCHWHGECTLDTRLPDDCDNAKKNRTAMIYKEIIQPLEEQCKK